MNIKKNSAFVGLGLILVLAFSCKKEDPIDLPQDDPTDPSTGVVITGTSWTSISAAFLPAKRAMAMLTVSDKLLVTYLDMDHISALYDGSTFQLSAQSPFTFGSGGGIEYLENIDGQVYGFGSLGIYGAFSFDITQSWSQWAEFAAVGTNMYSMEKYNGYYIGACGVAPRIRSTESGSWAEAGSGLNSSVTSLVDFNGEIIAAGSFTLSGTTTVNRVARWTGTDWMPLGTGLSGSVNDLVVYDGKLVAIGNFSANGDGNTACRYVAMWNGTTWESMGGGLVGGINGAKVGLVYNNQLIIGGQFDSADGVSSSNVIKWTTANGWESLAGGVNDIIGDMAVYKNHLYITNFAEITNGNFILRLD